MSTLMPMTYVPETYAPETGTFWYPGPGLPEYRRSPQITADHRRSTQITTDHQITYF